MGGEGSISPPPSKRRRFTEPASERVTTPPSSPNPDELVIYSWNVNGIGPLVQRRITSFFPSDGASKKTRETTSDEEAAATASLREVLRRYHWPTMLLLQEVKIHPGDVTTQKAVERAVRPARDNRSHEPSYVVRFCLPSDRYNARGFAGRVYGVCSIVRQDFYDAHVRTTRTVDWDAEGRFLICEIDAIHDCSKLAVINIYAVNGTEARYKDSRTGQAVGTRHDRKLQVHQKLQEECHALEARGYGVVIAGDLNIARSPLDGFPHLRTQPPQHCVNRADFESRFFATPATTGHAGGMATADRPSSLNMVDTFRELHPQRAGYTYYPRTPRFGASCDRVDMILVSRSLAGLLTKAGMHETTTDRGHSDHVPLYVKLALLSRIPRQDSD